MKLTKKSYFQNVNKNPDYAAMFRSRPLRFILPVNDKHISENTKNDCSNVYPEVLCDLGCETPRINDYKIGKKYRFFYAISSDVDTENPGTVIIEIIDLYYNNLPIYKGELIYKIAYN